MGKFVIVEPPFLSLPYSLSQNGCLKAITTLVAAVYVAVRKATLFLKMYQLYSDKKGRKIFIAKNGHNSLEDQKEDS